MDSRPKLQFDVAYPDHLSRGLIWVKWWLLAVPHFIVLYLLQIAFNVVFLISWVLILILGRYPRSLWEFSVLYLKWQARVTSYCLLQRDDYPPFGDGDYPVLFHLDYPDRLSRWKIFLKWLFVIPHLVVLGFLWIAVMVVWVIAWFAILFTGNFPRGMFDFVTGVQRWSYRVSVYYYLLTDAYPPFSMEPEAPQPSMDPSLGYGSTPPARF
jgi:hypothetical protein